MNNILLNSHNLVNDDKICSNDDETYDYLDDEENENEYNDFKYNFSTCMKMVCEYCLDCWIFVKSEHKK